MKDKHEEGNTREQLKCECGCTDFTEIDKNYLWKCNKCKMLFGYFDQEEAQDDKS